MIYSFLILLVVLQFFFPVLAKKIKFRFSQLGINMESKADSAWLNTTMFWKEAKQLNSSAKDIVISRYLWVYNLWWLMAILGAISLPFWG